MNTFLRLEYEDYGEASEVLQLREVAIPRAGKNQVLVKILAAPIHPSDFGMISARYGRSVSLPAVAGREGIGEIVETGKMANQDLVGQHVNIPDSFGSWQEYCLLDQESLRIVPRDIPVEMASMALINLPSAFLLLKKFVALEPGDWIIQNAANSAVGSLVIQMAKQAGIHTVNIVRRSELKPAMLQMGADIVLEEDSGYQKDITQFTNGSPIKLGLNAVGGQSVSNLIKSLAPDATLVSYGGMVGEKIRFPTRELIFNNITLSGFWVDHWKRQSTREEVDTVLEQMYELIRQKKIDIPVEASYPLREWKKALSHAAQPRSGKILFKH